MVSRSFLLLLALKQAISLCFHSLKSNNFRNRASLRLRSISEEDIELDNRAVEEENLMRSAPQSLLVQMKGATSTSLTNELKSNGVARIDRVISTDTCKELLEFVRTELASSLESTERKELEVESIFSSSLSAENRWDFKLPPSNIVFSALKILLKEGSLVGDTLIALLGPDAELFELAAFVTVKGAGRQVMHSDTLWSKLPCLFTCTLALQDVTPEMGPTVFIPASHTREVHRVFDNSKKVNSFLQSTPHLLSTLSTGSVAIYDSRTLHCGGANRGDQPRVLMYFTFTNPAGMRDDSDSWNVASIRAENKGAFRLNDFRK